MSASIVELFLLSLIDRGLTSKYELQRSGGVSLGSSTPALRRMQAAKLIVQDIDGQVGSRPRHALKLSAAGRRLARTGWKDHLNPSLEADLDSILRLVDMAVFYGADKDQTVAYLSAMAENRKARARSAAMDYKPESPLLGILGAQDRWRSIRLKAESTFLFSLAKAHYSPTPSSGQATMASSPTGLSR